MTSTLAGSRPLERDRETGGVRRLAALTALLALSGPGNGRAADFTLPRATPPFLGPCASEGFRLPGTDGCLRFSGSVAAEAGWHLASPDISFDGGPIGPGRAATASPDLSRPSLGVGTRLSADLHLPTDYGPVRIFVSLRGRNGSVSERGPR